MPKAGPVISSRTFTVAERGESFTLIISPLTRGFCSFRRSQNCYKKKKDLLSALPLLLNLANMTCPFIILAPPAASIA